MATPWEHDTHTIHAACRAATPVSTDSDVAVLQAAEAIIPNRSLGREVH